VEAIESGNAERSAVRCIARLGVGVAVRENVARNDRIASDEIVAATKTIKQLRPLL
jgi:hypothetical protein